MQMTNDKVQLFEDQPIRTAWVEDEEEWYFSVVDVVQALTESADGRKYWNKLKQRLVLCQDLAQIKMGDFSLARS